MSGWRGSAGRLIGSSVLAGAVLLAHAAAPARAQTQAPPEPPVMPVAPDPMAGLDADMAKLIATLRKLAPKPIETLEPAEARRQPGLSDARAKLVKALKLDPQPRAGLEVSDSRYADMGGLHLRFYVPEGASKETKNPVVLYFRGGGWVIGDLDDDDTAPAALARKTGAVVVSADYPLAPTERFPAAHEEAIAAYEYLLKHAEGWGYDPARVALVGEGAGGNLALATAIAARDRKLTPPVAIVAVHPIATTAMDTPSKRSDATAAPLNTAMITWFFGHVLRDESDRRDPRLNLIEADLRGLAPVTLLNAGIDPLRSDGELLAERLKEAGVETTHRVYEGVTHGFFGMDAVVRRAGEAQDLAAAQLLRGFESPR